MYNVGDIEVNGRNTRRRKNLVETPLKVRFADPADAELICNMGTADRSFLVSPLIRFYEKSEVEEWSVNRANNLMLVAEIGNRLVGFLFCKIMSQHWAMLDNFYISPSYRNRTSSRALADFLEKELRQRGISYLTCLVREDHTALARLLKAKGFVGRDRYTWFELFL